MIARARNAILNAVKESTENYFNDMRNVISDERFDVDVLNEETEKKEQRFVDEFESIMEPTPSEISIKKEAERREDVQVKREDEKYSDQTELDVLVVGGVLPGQGLSGEDQVQSGGQQQIEGRGGLRTELSDTKVLTILEHLTL